eukprot:1159084-Pelagomonas_calceolata.AAC.15
MKNLGCNAPGVRLRLIYAWTRKNARGKYAPVAVVNQNQKCTELANLAHNVRPAAVLLVSCRGSCLTFQGNLWCLLCQITPPGLPFKASAKV